MEPQLLRFWSPRVPPKRMVEKTKISRPTNTFTTSSTNTATLPAQAHHSDTGVNCFTSYPTAPSLSRTLLLNSLGGHLHPSGRFIDARYHHRHFSSFHLRAFHFISGCLMLTTTLFHGLISILYSVALRAASREDCLQSNGSMRIILGASYA